MTDPARLPRPNLLLRGVWWAADYVYAVRRQAAVLVPPWGFGPVRRPLPPAWTAGSDELPTVVLIPGVYEHWTFLRPLGDALAAAGHRVTVVRRLNFNRHSIAGTADRLAGALEKAAAPPAGRIVVAHSKGGLIAKHMLTTHTAEQTGVIGAVAVASPFSGVRLAGLFADPSIRAFRPSDETITKLAAATAANERIASVYGPFDPHIPEGSVLPGARNIPVPTSGHFRILGAESTHRAVVEAVAELAASFPAPPRAH